MKKRHYIMVLLAIISLLTSCCTLQIKSTAEGIQNIVKKEKTTIAIVNSTIPYVVCKAENDCKQYEFKALGTGFVINAKERYVLTNQHVINNAILVKVKIGDVRVKAKVVAEYPKSDLAVLKLDYNSNLDLEEVKFATKNEINIGDTVIPVGHPRGLYYSYSKGIISQIRNVNLYDRGKSVSVIQIDAHINPGNSGGPIFNLQGKVVGISTYMISPVRASTGLNFGVSAMEITSLLIDYIPGTKIFKFN